ncbi:unnamed protein product [Penicillium salamii]|uniref:Uncharacterized protein n=1 Tax=Penicillium salamii TaxID=1612424 RepID=A0A9W4K161_9EURO|nr:unnamed protein product [Penicillium salamii]CAG8308774.1 unnamed protein product [Penicillium salamii]CAG8335952.1 unnamed protein product [Penicillium salamii]CAG8372726.1 unnamed protein product [Penicillium salamii]CAG8411587.1 unnamed protein product [Penicillium salamii]
MLVKSSDATHYALQTLNRRIEHRLEKLRANTTRLKRELWLLQRHVKEFRHPLFENWEADLLTRLIEVAYASEYRKLPGGVVIGKETFSERENLTRAYSLAARDIRSTTIRKLGLSDRYHEALQRYPEVSCGWTYLEPRTDMDQVAPYRSQNPFRTEFAFAKWLVEEKESRPELYGFWSKLFPVCYDRSVQQSASFF